MLDHQITLGWKGLAGYGQRQ